MTQSPIFYFAFSLLTLSAAGYSARMDRELLEAAYQFEIKGNFTDAEDQLSRISLEGDDEDKSKAFFLLGKIQEISEKPQNAVFYYRQALIHPSNSREAYFIASRIAELDSTPERLVQRTSKVFPAPIRNTVPGSPPSVLLSNNKLYDLKEDRIVPARVDIPENAKIHSVSQTGIWYSLSGETLLHFQSKDSKEPGRSYRFGSEILDVVPIAGIGATVMTEKDFSFVGNEGIRFSIDSRYRGCVPLGEYASRNELVLNCPDNALHLLNAENGDEIQTIPQIDPIQSAILSESGIFILSASSIQFYKPQISPSCLWKYSGKTVEAAAPFDNRIAVLESGGKLNLLDPETGRAIATSQVDGKLLFELSSGVLGIFSQEGALVAVDTLLRPLWQYHFGKPLVAEPVKSEGFVFLPFENGRLVVISALHYGKKPLLSRELARDALEKKNEGDRPAAIALVDSIKDLEPGNPTANYLQAMNLERTGASEKPRANAWAEAVRVSSGDEKEASSILSHYAKIIGAEYVRFLPLSPRTLYPSLFGSGGTLFTIDPAARNLLALDPATGTVRWIRDLDISESSPVTASDASHLAIASGFRINIQELSKNGKNFSSELPGKPFQVKFSGNALFASTWNGYFVKLLAPKYNVAWSRKLFNLPFLFDISENRIAVASIEGSAAFVNDATGQTTTRIPDIGTNVNAVKLSDTLFAISTDKNEIQVYGPGAGSPLQTIQAEESVLSLNWIPVGTAHYLLAGLANQKLFLYGQNSSEPVWSFAGSGSIYTLPVLAGNFLFLDQTSSIVQISLSKGTVEKRYPTPGGASTPFVLNGNLFCTSPKRLLYAFPLLKISK